MLNLKHLRTKFRLTQSEAARLVGVAPNTWARWERGEMAPDRRSLKLIALLPDLIPSPSPSRK